jgi:peptidoglycan hydrolase CwlO-like protein
MDEAREGELIRNIRSLKDEVAEKDRQVTHAEKQSEDLLQELKAEKAKIDELHDKIKALKEKEANNEKYITKIEGDAKDFQNQVTELQSDKAQLEAQIGSERGDHQRVVVEQHSLRAKYDTLRTDANGVRSKLETEQTENKRLKKHIDELKTTITGLEHVQTELEEEKKISDGLRNQWARLKDELPRFNADPQVAIKPQIASGPGPDGQQPKTSRSLAFELEGRSSLSGSTLESGAESGDSTLSDVASNDGSFSSSDDSEDNDDDYGTEIGGVDGHEVMRNVYVHVYVPYRTYAHNPFRCWFQVDINTLFVFRNWLLEATARAAPLLRRTGRIQSIRASNPAHSPSTATNTLSTTSHSNGNMNGYSTSSTSPQNTNGAASQTALTPQAIGDISTILGPAPQAGTMGTANGSPALTGTSSTPLSGTGHSNTPSLAMFVATGGNRGESFQPSSRPPVSPELREVAELIEPVVLDEDNRPSFESGENLPHEANLPRSWWNIDRNNNPPAAQTLFWFALHLVFYYLLYVCYQNYCEREIWISANESARKLLVEVLALRNRDGRGFTSQIFSEKAVRLIDHFILYAFSLFKVETQPWQIPG